MTNALWISVIGMGLVFFAILLLWGLMALLVQFTAEAKPGSPRQQDPPQELEAVVEPPQVDLRRRAAAAAVAAALALERQLGRPCQPEQGETGSPTPWQVVNRAAGVNQRPSLHRDR